MPSKDAEPHDYDAEQWSRTEHLIAAVRDELHALRHHYLSAHSARALKWDPEPLPRPGISARGTAVSTEQTDMLAAHLARFQGQD